MHDDRDHRHSPHHTIVESPFGRKLDGMMELNSAPSIDVRPVITHPPSPPCLAGHDSKGVTMTRSRLFLCREQLVGLRANPLLLIRQAVAVRQRQRPTRLLIRRVRARPFKPCLALAPPVKTSAPASVGAFCLQRSWQGRSFDGHNLLLANPMKGPHGDGGWLWQKRSAQLSLPPL